MAGEAELLQHDQKQSKEFSTPSRVSSELRLGLLNERNFITNIRNKLSSQPSSWPLGGRARCCSQRCCLLAGIWRQTLEKLPFNKSELMRSSALFGMLIAKRPGEKCLGIKGVTTPVHSFWFSGEGTNRRMPELGYYACLNQATKSHQTAPRSSPVNLSHSHTLGGY